MHKFHLNDWAVILGGSSGFGLATAKKLAAHGMNLCIVHRDRRGAMERIDKEFEELRKTGCKLLTLNLDALSLEGITEVITKLKEAMQPSGRVRLLLHSIAFGNLKTIAPYQPEKASTQAIQALSKALNISTEEIQKALASIPESEADALHPLIPPSYGAEPIQDEDMARTIYSMGTNLLTWVQELFKHKLFAADARVMGMTSEGNEVAWRGYAAVSAAKVALESVIRSIAVEFAPYGIRANTIQAGVTDTPALRAIPGSQRMKSSARLRNPFNRLTEPTDVANFIYLMCLDEAAWVNGTIIRVDGGEHISSS
jgi:NAD(P)-dependent dehydrogenase (short-subunit alcohol dehydrogenase family)